MTDYHRSWQIMTDYDILLQIMTYYDILLQIMTDYDGLWQIIAYYDILWQIMADYDRLWQIMMDYDQLYAVCCLFKLFLSKHKTVLFFVPSYFNIVHFIYVFFHFGIPSQESLHIFIPLLQVIVYNCHITESIIK